MRFSPGDSVGPYRVTGVIGEGAMGVVYQVVNGVTGRLEAMKVLTDDVSHDLEQGERFLHEIQVQARPEHPNIAQVRTAFCEGRTLIMVMEQVDGDALSGVRCRLRSRRCGSSIRSSRRLDTRIQRASFIAT
ncbi:MAG: hypothetical protein FJW38_11985 [Acidobacteria bacterium]|nr:hypothetical protein [Acidobacteriota bacterium]